MKWTALAVCTALLAVVGADLAIVKQDISAIESAVIDLDERLHIPDMGYSSALGIHNAAAALTSKIQQGTRDVEALPGAVSSDETRTLLETLRGLEVHVRGAAQQLIAVQPAFDGLGVMMLARQDVAAVVAGTDAFGAALVGKAAEQFGSEAQALADAFNAHLKAAADVYGVSSSSSSSSKDEL